jgi:glycosyltransferase involved in cell wall biosynthesis
MNSRPIHVCFLIDDLATAGTETQLLALIRHLDRRRVRPFLALLRGDSAASQALEPEDCPVLRLGVKALRSPRTALRAWQFTQFLWREQIDVVQAYFPDSSYFGIPTAWLAGVRHRVRTRNNIGHWLTRTHQSLGRMLNLLTTATVANCRAAREALLLDERPPADRVHVLENGVDLARFLDLPLPTGAPRCVGVVANLRPVKGLDVFLTAAGLLRERFPKVSFRIAGEGEQRGALEEQARQLGLAQRVQLCGAQSDVPAFLAGLDVAVLSSRAEGMSNAVLEYMAAARPIVATAVGATPELIQDGVHGLLVPAGNAESLARAISTLLVERDHARWLGQAARERAASVYSRQAMVRRFEEFYTRLVCSEGKEDDTATRRQEESSLR